MKVSRIKSIHFRKYYIVPAIHILMWIVLFFIPRIFIPRPVERIHTEKEWVLWISMIIVFYTNYLFLVPKFLAKRKILIFFLFVLALLVTGFFLNIYLENKYGRRFILRNQVQPLPPRALPHNGNPAPFRIPPERMRVGEGLRGIIFVTLVLAVSTSLKITEQWYQDEKKIKEIQNQKLTAELALLRSQINPHFFFNTLNTIYSLASKKSDLTTDAILKLSGLMRYIIYHSEQPFVFLKDEIEYIKNYLDLQKLRFQKNVNIQFNISGKLANQVIEPMLLLPFIENAFKHGIDYSRACQIVISLEFASDQLILYVENPMIVKSE
ncbi:MAG: histidine kinase, partial [Thermoanaerobaculaceae bacterium]|nr:histidine kinase [Thermoanaerobaculaceae bacterium]